MRLGVLRWFLIAIFIITLSFYISNNWYSIMLIQGDSMSPSYRDKQFVILDRHSDDFSYGDVVAFWCESLSSVLVKRITACPGDQAVIKDGTLYVNGEISEVYPVTGVFEYMGILEQDIQLEEGEYIVIGDNIDVSKDSRYEMVKEVKKSDVIGKIAIFK